MVSELVLTRNQLLDIARRSDSPDGFKAPLQRLSHVTAELQNGVMKTRMQPVRTAWSKLPRVVRDLSLDLGKDLALVMEGSDTELDRQVLEIIRDPLTHMVRNAADHGIEAPAARRRAGKPAQGTIRLNAFQEGGTITIEVSDDGRGLDYAAVRRQAVAMELVSTADAQRLGDEQVAELIFHPGFSTASAVGAVSGRGVGMDVVKSNIGLIGGTIEIASTPGRGSTFRIKIPLTLAIVAALIVQIGSQRFALPQLSVVELVRVGLGAEHTIERVGGAALLRLRNTILPVVDLAALMGFEAAREDGERGFVIVTEVGRQRFGLLVDAVLETEEIVVKPMSRLLKDLQLFSGNTIMGDGAVVLIVDPNGVARRIGAEVLRNVPDSAESASVTSIAQTDTILVFRGADGGPKALPLSLVMRLEEVDAAAIEWSGGQPRLQYRGRLLPVVPIDDGALRREGQQPLVIVSDGERLTGLAVREIIDVVECVLDIQGGSAGPGRAGSAIVRGRATDIVDLAAFLPQGHEGSAGLPGTGEAATILLVDDNPFFRDMLSPVLRASGYQVKTACGIEDALRHLARGGIELLVTDLDLGGRSGFELVERLRRRPETARMHVVALSSGRRRGGAAARPRARHLRCRGEVRPERATRRAGGNAGPGRRAGRPRGRGMSASSELLLTERRAPSGARGDLVAVTIGDQLFGIPIRRVHDVFVISELTPVPLARADVAGLLNIRGRVVTAIDLRRRLGLPALAEPKRRIAVGIEVEGESFGLIVDDVREILSPSDEGEDYAGHLGERWAALSRVVHRLETSLLIELDVDAVLDLAPNPKDSQP
jgi:two-component system chemotaxis sensor kinase CheA